MDTIIDIIGATVIAGLVMLGIANLNVYSSQMRFKSDSDLKLQMDAKTISEILGNDLRKIGYAYTGTPIITANEKEIKFYADIDSNNVMDIISFSLSDSNSVISENPNERILYRAVNADTSKGPSLGMVNLKFTYKDGNGNITSDPVMIKYIKAEIWVQSSSKVNENGTDKFISTYWELTINPRNI